MKALFLSFLFITSVFAEFEVNGNIGLDSQSYITVNDAKHKQNFTAYQELELKYTYEDLTLYSKLYAQEDSYDFSSDDAKKNERTFARLDELYFKYDFADDMLSGGKSIKYWGALEVRNIVDGFNPRDFRTDMFDSQKLGVYNLSYSHYTESGEISAIVKFNEEDQPMAAYPYAYYFFPSFVSYDGEVKENASAYELSYYLSYTGSTDTEYALDYAFIYQYGYDSQRYSTTDTPENLDPTKPTFAQPTEFKQYAYLTNKFMTYNTLVVGATLIKLEALYAIVDDNAYIGDYSHVALGVEHTLENFLGSEAGLGLIAEYYRYDTYEDDKYTDLELFETMQNDLFLGLRYSFNNANDTSLIGGVIADVEYDEQSYYMNFDTRAYDSFKVGIDYYYINPSKNTTTAYALLGKHQRVGLNIGWYF